MSSRPQFVDLDLQNAVKVVNSPDPSAAQDVATKAYVDNAVNGLDEKQSVRCATTANITLSGEQTIDGVLTATSRVLVKDQSTGANNGLYLSGAGAWTRTTDADVSSEVTAGMLVIVEEGSANGPSSGNGNVFLLTTANPITLGVTALTFTRYQIGITYVAGTGMILSGTTFNVQATDASITVNADDLKVNPGTAANTSLETAGGSLRVASAGIGAGLSGGSGSAIIADTSVTPRWKTQVTHSSGTTVTFTHSLGKANLDYLVGVFYTGTGTTPGLDISAGVNIVKASNAVTVTFNASQSANTIGITVVG